MAEYIEREAAEKRLLEMAETAGNNRLYYEQECMETAAEVISDFPAAEVAQVVHGRWTQVDETKCRCSNCDIIALIGLYPHGDKNYCPNCGAKMIGGENNG